MTILNRLASLLAAVLLFVSLAAGAGAAAQPVLHLADDRGQAIGEALEVCFQLELSTDCRRVGPGETVLPPAVFFSVRIEGEEHGPVKLRRGDLRPREDGGFRVEVARKAWLRIQGMARRQPLTVALYEPRDLTFREPAFRARLQAGEAEVRVPAGEFVASLAQARNAPDLQRLSAKPAERVRRTYRPRQGWSLIARLRAAADLRPVSRAKAEVAEAVGYGREERPIAQARSGADGLVLLSGLQAPLASLTARHPHFLPAKLRGLTAPPGSFAFREMDLGRGGRVVAHVTAHGRPLAAAKCRIYVREKTYPVTPATKPEFEEPYRQIWEGIADPQGVCRSGALEAGTYKLRVQYPDSTAQVSRWVTVLEGQDAEEDVALVSSRVYGEVRRGGDPVSGYAVVAMLVNRPDGKEVSDTSSRASSDEEGRYELALWTPGDYFLQLLTGSEPVGQEQVTVEGSDERRVDFDLHASTIRGIVVDEAGRPLEEAVVPLQWQLLVSVASTGADGAFELEIEEGEGTAELQAMKLGYRESETIKIPIAKGVPIPPVTLVLKSKGTVRGTLLSAAGHPVPEAWVVSLQEAGLYPYFPTRSKADGSFEVEVPPGPPRVFVSAPACPLSWFDLPVSAVPGDPGPAPVLRCPAMPGALELILLDTMGKPMPGSRVILRREGTLVPPLVLAGHLQFLGLPAETDGAGRLVLPGLAPGEYELFLGSLTHESLVAGGDQQGYLTTVSLPALQTTRLEWTVTAGGRAAAE